MKPRASHRHAFTLLEILVSTAMMALIVFVLVYLLATVQRTFKGGHGQNTTFDAGHAVLDFLAHDLSQVDFYEENWVTNLVVRSNPLVGGQRQAFPGATAFRTNFVYDHWSQRYVGNRWISTVYRLLPDGTGNGSYGSLYRFTYESLSPEDSSQMGDLALRTMDEADLAEFSAVAAGIIHLDIYPLDSQGWLIANAPVYRQTPDEEWRFHGSPSRSSPYYVSNAIPVYLEIEIGVLDPKVLEKARVMEAPSERSAFLAGQISKVHLFRKRIPIQTAPRKP